MQSAQTLEQLDPFDHAFVDAVLQLRGIDEPPTYEQFRAALGVLGEYYAALMKAPASSDPDDDKWLEGHTIDSAAFRLAFLWVRYGVLYLSQATPDQLAVWRCWWRTGDVPTAESVT